MRHKLGQVIALSRLALASVFLLAIYVDPSQPAAAPGETYLILGIYVVVALAMLLATWRNWWLDHRLARPAHWIDLMVFAAVVFSTEGYTSPFFTFSLFLLLSSAIRWGRREVTRTAIAVNLLFLAAGFASAVNTPGEVDLQRLLIRGTYLAVLSLLFIWYSRSERDAERYVLRASLSGSSELPRVVELIVEHVGERLGSDHLVCAWRQQDGGEPHACCREDARHMRLEIGRDELSRVLDEAPERPFLFDAAKDRLLVQGRGEVRSALCPASIASFLEPRGIIEGLGVPVEANGFRCVVFAGAVVSVDDLAIGGHLAEDAAFLHEQAVVNRLSREAAASQARLAVARDLHDSVAQLLAGTSFRLEALKRTGKSGEELAGEFEALQRELASEQDHVRSLIAELRQPNEARGETDRVARFEDLVDRLARQWGVEVAFEQSGLQSDTPAFDNELEQMIREGVANAVRHGRAKQVTICLRADTESHELRITDNGCGLPVGDDGTEPVMPRSLHERAQALGGSLQATRDAAATVIRIRLPVEAAP